MPPATAAFLYPAVAVSSRALPLRRARHLAVRAVASLPASKPVPAPSKVWAIGWTMYNVLVSNEKPIQSQYKSHVYANPEIVTQDIIDSRYELTKRKGARFVPAAFLTGFLDPVQ